MSQGVGMSRVRLLLRMESVIEGGTGLLLIASPSSPALLARLVFGAAPSDAGIALGRLAGIALLAVGTLCWPTRATENSPAQILYMLLTYNLLTTTSLACLGIAGGTTGILLWRAAAILSIFALLFG